MAVSKMHSRSGYSQKKQAEVESLILNATHTMNESQMPSRDLIKEINHELDELTNQNKKTPYDIVREKKAKLINQINLQLITEKYQFMLEN